MLGDEGVKICVGLAKASVEGVEVRELLGDGLHGFFHHLLYGFGLVELGLLLQHAYRVALGEHRLAQVVFVDAGHDAKQRALARAVQTQHADFGAVEEGEGNVADDFAVVGRKQALDAHHGIDDLVCHGVILPSECAAIGARVAASPEHPIGLAPDYLAAAKERPVKTGDGRLEAMAALPQARHHAG